MTTEKTPDERNRVVVGVDGSESSKHALRWAQFIARASDSTLEVVSAWQPYTAYGWMSAGWAVMPTNWNPAQDTEKALTATIDEVFGEQRPTGLQLTVREGNAAQTPASQRRRPNARRRQPRIRRLHRPAPRLSQRPLHRTRDLPRTRPARGYPRPS